MGYYIKLNKVLHVVLAVAMMMAAAPIKSVFANEGTVYMPLFQTVPASPPPLMGSMEFQQFHDKMMQIMSEMTLEVLDNGQIQIGTNFPQPNEGVINAASTNSIDAELYQEISVLVEMFNTGALEIKTATQSNNIRNSSDVLAASANNSPDFDWEVNGEWVILTFHNGELTVIKWISGEALGLFTGAVVGYLAGGLISGTVATIFGWFVGNYMEDYVLEDYIPDQFDIAISTEQWADLGIGIYIDYPFYSRTYISGSADYCNYEWEKYNYSWWNGFYLAYDFC